MERAASRHFCVVSLGVAALRIARRAPASVPTGADKGGPERGEESGGTDSLKRSGHLCGRGSVRPRAAPSASASASRRRLASSVSAFNWFDAAATVASASARVRDIASVRSAHERCAHLVHLLVNLGPGGRRSSGRTRPRRHGPGSPNARPARAPNGRCSRAFMTRIKGRSSRRSTMTVSSSTKKMTQRPIDPGARYLSEQTKFSRCFQRRHKTSIYTIDTVSAQRAACTFAHKAAESASKIDGTALADPDQRTPLADVADRHGRDAIARSAVSVVSAAAGSIATRSPPDV